MFVTGLNSLLNQLELSEDLFSFGPTSRLIANKLTSLEQSHERQKVTSYHITIAGNFILKTCKIIFTLLNGRLK